MLINKCSVPIHSNFSQAEVVLVNTTRVSTTWFSLEAFIEPENAEYFMLLEWIDGNNMDHQWREVGRRKMKFGFTYVFLYIVTINSKWRKSLEVSVYFVWTAWRIMP